MRKLPLILFLVAVLLSFCTTNPKVKTAVISGRIDNLNANEIFVMEDYEIVKDTLQVESGNFSKTIQVQESRMYDVNINDKKISIYVSPGDSITFYANYKHINGSLVFTGTAKNENELIFVLSKNQTRREYFQDAQKQLHYYDSIAQSKISLIENFAKNNPTINKGFVSQQKRKYYYENASYKIRYPMMMRSYVRKPIENYEKSFMSGIDTLMLEDPDMVYYEEYKFYVLNYLKKLKKDGGSKVGRGNELAFLQYLADTLKNPAIRDYIIEKYILLSWYDEKTQDSVIDFVNHHVTTPVVLHKLNNEYNRLASLRKGAIAPYWEAFDRLGTIHSINDFKGKWLYLEVWASSCKFCTEEIPHFKMRKEEYQNSNIVFACISIDHDEKKWERALKEHILLGNQFHCPEKEFPRFSEEYMVKGVPSFYLIDPLGKIYMKNPPRPSQKVDFENLMNEIGII
ncbi:AhpC/TSA family protein [Bacteroidales bacterium]|nr:AhpC/TSA family protein [Bacteroidales bacterium]